MTSSENRVTVHAKKETTTDGGKCSREFCRMVQLPKSIDDSQLKCRMTDVSCRVDDCGCWWFCVCCICSCLHFQSF